MNEPRPGVGSCDGPRAERTEVRRFGIARTALILAATGAVIAASGLAWGGSVVAGGGSMLQRSSSALPFDALISVSTPSGPERVEYQVPQQRIVRPHWGIPDSMASANAEPPVGPNTSPPAIPPTDGPIIQLCLVLDTSNSMDGLINQAKARLWSVVNELGRASERNPCPRCGPMSPQLQVAVYEYGNNSIEAADGYVRLRIPFTTDLDLVSEQLFSLRTNGGLEYCGWAIREAVSALAWVPVSGDEARGRARPAGAGPGKAAANAHAEDAFCMRGAIHTVVCPIDPVVDEKPVDNSGVVLSHTQPVMRVLVIAGNEPFTQGTVHYAEAISEAVAAGITVHTVFCGPKREGETTGWADGARLGNGRYMWIDQDTSFTDIATPFDGRLTELNTALNATYLPYGGRDGRAAFERQTAQDQSNARAGSLASRAAVKSSEMYSNTHWDLIDALVAKTVSLETLKDEDLPDVLRGKSIDERRVIVANYQRDRERVRGEMQAMSRQRAEFLMSQRRRGTEGVRLDDAIVQAVREQAEREGLRFADEQADAKPAAKPK